MITRFEKALQQVAQRSGLNDDRLAHEHRAQKVRRLEELIRAKEATGDRIVMGIGAALVVSAMALPVYVSFVREGYAYLPSVGGSLTFGRGSGVERPQRALLPDADAVETTNSIPRPAEGREDVNTRRQDAAATPFARYVVHRATEASALIEGPNGLWWVTPGMKIPGIGQILSIEHSDAGWAVVTSETTISEAAGRYAGY
ncbi:hypothetical protein [Microvirga pakistanensis]|uniref:hypothetical protein n=1 Tax=Microvirga pakistanensis TaxID=1682650 RepID=UPI00106A758E|nr:hypothetical protein [Microvirga pakistanensis]